jgi:heme-degrading monooxygenase HmoA
MVVRRIVDDYEAWKQRFEEQSPKRQAAGARSARRFRSLENPNEICVIIEWESIEKGAAYFGIHTDADPALKSQMDPVFMEEIEPLDG